MKAILINLGIILAIIAMYYLDFWVFFTSKNSFWYVLLIVAVLLLVGLKVLGTPFGRGNDDDQK